MTRSKASVAGALLAKKRVVSMHRCAACRAQFLAIATAKYCSNLCRQSAKYYRLKDAGQEAAAGRVLASVKSKS